MSELTIRPDTGEIVTTTDPTGGRLVAWAQAAQAAHQLATALARTAFVPKHFQGNSSDATAAILLGDELGLSPISALRSIYVIGGAPALYARTMVALVMSHGHRIWTVEDTPARVTVAGQRRGSDRVEQVTWTAERARKAGYTSNRKYETDPQAMLYARASGDVARRIAPDVIAGVPATVEEIELGDVETVTVTREPAAPRRVSRAKPAPEPEEPPLDVEPEPETPDVEPITAAQLRALHAALSPLADGDRDTGLAIVSGVIGRDVDTTKDLSKAEASRVIDALKSQAEAIGGAA